MSHLVIVPAYNEREEVLRSVVTTWLATGAAVCVVDDGSALPVALERAGVTVLRHPTNRGQGAALQTGLDYGLTTDHDYFLTVDADGQHPASNLAALLAPLRDGRADVVFGSRFRRSDDAASVPFVRRLVLRLAVGFNNFITGLRMTDAHNGLRALNRTAASKIRIREPRMAHASEIPLRVRQSGLRWCEVPVSIAYTDYATKKGQSLWRALPLSWQLIKLKWRNR